MVWKLISPKYIYIHGDRNSRTHRDRKMLGHTKNRVNQQATKYKFIQYITLRNPQMKSSLGNSMLAHMLHNCLTRFIGKKAKKWITHSSPNKSRTTERANASLQNQGLSKWITLELHLIIIKSHKKKQS